MENDCGLVYQKIPAGNPRLCGCYVVNPELLKEKQNHYIIVPLNSCEYQLEIVNSLTNVTLVQTYHNPTDKFLEIEYNFPVNPQACIYKFSAQFGKTRIEGIVKEKEQAKKEYVQALQQGKKVVYGEIRPESKDILTLKVGNVPPNQSVKIEIAYLQELALSCNTFYQLHMPATITPRYMNYIPQQKIKEGFRNQGLKTKGQFYWNFRISLKTTRKVTFFDSHTHDIDLVSQNDANTLSEFVMTKSCVPNKDFTFTFTTEDFQLPSSVFGRTDVGSTAMLSFIPKFCDLGIDDAYKASVAGKNFETDIDNARGQYIFLLDRSGSMGGTRIQKAKQALVLFIKSLPQDTYFNVISFGSSSENLFIDSAKYSDKEINEAVKKVNKMSADLGGTQIYRPLQKIITRKPMDGYAKQIFLLTDGGVSNTEGVIRMVGLNNKYSRVHTIGIGNGASQSLILGCAKSGRGSHVFINDSEDPAEKIIQLLTDSLSPVINKINLKFDKSVVESIIPNPESMPYVLKNEIVNFYVTFKGQLQKPAEFHFSYEDSINKLPYKSQIIIDPETQSEFFVDKMGHFKRIRLLEDSLRNNGNIEESMYYVKNVDKKAEIIKESVTHQILSEFTAFICVEKELVDGQYQQIKDKGQQRVQIQNPKPVQYEENQRYGGGFSGMALVRGQALDNLQAKSIDLSSNAKMFCKSAKKESSGGIFDKITSFFTGSMKKESMAPPMMEQAAMAPMAPIQACIQQRCAKIEAEEEDDEMDMGGMFGDEMMEQHSIKLDEKQQSKKSQSRARKASVPEKKKAKKKQEEKKETSASIKDIIAAQAADGSWKDIQLIALLFNAQVKEAVAQAANVTAVITYMISKWIQKHHPGAQYSLVVKKGLNYVKKNTESLEKFAQSYDKYI